MKMNYSILSLAAFGLIAVSPAMADQKEGLLRKADRGVTGQGYGTAGCGLGSIVFGNERGFTQVFAATTNGTSGSQTFGITSGTSNCKDGDGSAQNFIESNRVALLNDAARGNGETIEVLSRLYGCTDSSALGQSLQSNFSGVFSSEASSMDIDSNIRGIILNSSDLSSSCQSIG